MEGVAGHGDGDVEVDLHFVANAGLDEEVLLFIAAEVGGEFVVGEPEAGGEEDERYEAAAGGAGCVGLAGFGWRGFS